MQLRTIGSSVTLLYLDSASVKKRGVSTSFPIVSVELTCEAEFPVAGISEIQWSSTPFDCLTIPKEQKDAVMALAEARTNSATEHGFDDFIAGKGRSLVVLLQYVSPNPLLCVRSSMLAVPQEWGRRSRPKLSLNIFSGLSIQ